MCQTDAKYKTKSEEQRRHKNGEKMAKRKTKSKKPIPLVAPPTKNCIKSRKKARQITTLFHKYTQILERAQSQNDEAKVQEYTQKIEEIGGREQYQKASICSTSHHSTSKKWVLKILGQRNLLDGVIVKNTTNDDNDDDRSDEKERKKRTNRRNLEVLEIGAINTDLLDAAAKTRTFVKKQVHKEKEDGESTTASSSVSVEEHVYKLNVKAIDINSMDQRIEQMDFFDLPYLNQDESKRYDVIVNSMVLNCVPSAEKRGHMLALLYQHLNYGGLCFLMLPKLCLVQSKFITLRTFKEMLTVGIGFNIEEIHETPKVIFFLLSKTTIDTKNQKDKEKERQRIEQQQEVIKKYNHTKIINRPKKYRNLFSVTLHKKYICS